MQNQIHLPVIALLFSAACSNEPLEDSKKYDPAILQESYVITYIDMIFN